MYLLRWHASNLTETGDCCRLCAFQTHAHSSTLFHAFLDMVSHILQWLGQKSPFHACFLEVRSCWCQTEQFLAVCKSGACFHRWYVRVPQPEPCLAPGHRRELQCWKGLRWNSGLWHSDGSEPCSVALVEPCPSGASCGDSAAPAESTRGPQGSTWWWTLCHSPAVRSVPVLSQGPSYFHQTGSWLCHCEFHGGTLILQAVLLSHQ